MRKTTHILRALFCTVFAFALGGAGCTGSTSGGGGGGDGPDAAVVTADCESLSGAPSVTIGGGVSTTGYVALEDGAEMVGYVGPQGLFMVTPSLCVQNMWPGQAGRNANNPNDPEVVFSTYLVSSGAEIGGSAIDRLGLKQAASCDELLAVFVPFFNTISTEQYLNQQVRLEVTVKDACSQTSTDQLTIVVTQQ